MFLFGARRFGPLGLAYTGYQLYRRLSPQQKQAIRRRAGQFAQRARDSRTARPRPR